MTGCIWFSWGCVFAIFHWIHFCMKKQNIFKSVVKSGKSVNSYWSGQEQGVTC